MRCQKVRSCLSAFCSDELSGRRRLAVSEHLADCQACRQESDLFISIHEGARQLPSTSLSEDFNATLLNRIARERFAETRSQAHLPKAAPLFRWSRVVPAVATVCVALLVGVIAFNPGGDRPQMMSNVGSTGSSVVSNGDAGLDDAYLTVLPHDGHGATAYLDREWSLSKQLARSNRVTKISRDLAHGSDFVGGSGMALASTQSRIRLPFGARHYQTRPIVRIYVIPGGSTDREVVRPY